MKKIISMHGQVKGYKSVSKQLDFPVTTVDKIIMKLQVHGAVADLPGCGGGLTTYWTDGMMGKETT